MALLDQTTLRLNSQNSQVLKIGNLQLVDYYESTLRVFETLLEAIRLLPSFSPDFSQIHSASILAEDCSDRVSKMDAALRICEDGKKLPENFFEGVYPEQEIKKKIGCYFCSRPFVEGRFSLVRVRIDVEIKQVAACQICREELETTKKIKVLYFMKNGKPVHWTEVEDYTPMEDFWNINKKSPVRKERHLELVPRSEEDVDGI